MAQTVQRVVGVGVRRAIRSLQRRPIRRRIVYVQRRVRLPRQKRVLRRRARMLQIRVMRRRRFPECGFSNRSMPLLLARRRTASAKTPGKTDVDDDETLGPVKLSS